MARIEDRRSFVRYLLKHSGPICHYCGRRLSTEQDAGGELSDDRITLDHIVPRSKGGSDHLENFALSCPSCNQKKGSAEYENHCVGCRERFAKAAAEMARRAARPQPKRRTGRAPRGEDIRNAIRSVPRLRPPK